MLFSCKTRTLNDAFVAQVDETNSATVLATCAPSEELKTWQFPAPQTYSTMTAEAKRELLWKHGVQGSCYRANELPATTPGLDTVQVFQPEFLKGSFDLKTDWNFSGRKKLIHSKGSVVKVRFVPNDYSKSTYTGIYQTGGIGLARFSLATGISKTDVAPGMALKFIVSGKELSRDVFVMFSVDGQGSDQNLFSKDFANIVPAAKSFKTKLLVKAFEQVKANPNRMKVSHLANVTADGEMVSSPKAPVNLLFRPKIQGWAANDFTDFRFNLIKYIGAGKTIYDVYALSGSRDTLDVSSAKLIGELIAESEAIPSKFGDDILWYSHARDD
jgi:hypothetical protein